MISWQSQPDIISCIRVCLGCELLLWCKSARCWQPVRQFKATLKDRGGPSAADHIHYSAACHCFSSRTWQPRLQTWTWQLQPVFWLYFFSQFVPCYSVCWILVLSVKMCQKCKLVLRSWHGSSNDHVCIDSHHAYDTHYKCAITKKAWERVEGWLLVWRIKLATLLLKLWGRVKDGEPGCLSRPTFS